MAEQKIMGVDFSGAETKNGTEVTEAVLRGSTLELKPYEALPKELPCTHNELKKRILDLPCNAVISLDFPFSVPWAFAKEIAEAEGNKPASTMSDMWEIVEKLDYCRFKQLRDSSFKRHRELLRCGDSHFEGPLSPLHVVNPSMLLMTLRGMQLLYDLRGQGCRVPPLADENHKGQTLLETMPGVWLRWLGLPAMNFKKNDQDSRNVRKEILDGLEKKAYELGLGINIPGINRKECKDNHDYLDSLVAAVGAALWVKKRDIFLKPHRTLTVTDTNTDPKRKNRFERLSFKVKTMPEIEAARLEGWIYAPKSA